MNIIKTQEALAKWLWNHGVKFGIVEKINGELPRYAQLQDGSPDDAVVVTVLVPAKRDYLESEIVPFSVHKRSDFPSRPKAQFREEDTALSGAEYLLGAKTDMVKVPAILDKESVDGPAPHPEKVPQEVVEAAAPKITSDAERAQVVKEIEQMETVLADLRGLVADYDAATPVGSMGPNGNMIVP